MSAPLALRSTPLVLDSSVINDPRRVEKIEDRGETAYRSRLGHTRKAIQADKLGTTDNIIDAVGEQLYEARVVFDPAHETWFIPRTSFDDILTPEVIAQIVGQLVCYGNMSPEERIQVANDIYYGKDSSLGARGPCRKLLATLIGVQGDGGRLETVEEVKRHMDEGISDDCLPLLYDGDGLLICRLHGHSHSSINHERPRRGQWRESFVRWSRSLMVPYILWAGTPGSLHRHYVMYGGGPLPMAPVSKSSGPHIHYGDFDNVLKVRIQAGDRDFQDSRGQDSFFALKKLKENGEAARIDFDLEVRSLIYTESRANRIPGPDDGEAKRHFIQLLASFEVYNSNSKYPTYYLLFPWADGNLDEFWQQQDGNYSPRNQAQTGWMIEQFYHLAAGLQCLHNDRRLTLPEWTGANLYMRHGDLKPGNFLFFYDSNGSRFKLVLAGFGLGRLHSNSSRSMGRGIPKPATYAAPEYDIEGGLLSPRSDIFSFGCVLLEHMVWLFDGYSAVETFADERMSVDQYGFESDTFWKVSDSDRTSAEIKDKVSERLTTLKNHDDCVEVIGEMLEMIEKKMLQPRQVDRCTSHDLVNELDKIRRRWARRDSFYGTRAWKKSELPFAKGTLSGGPAPSILQTDDIFIAEPFSISDATPAANPDFSGRDTLTPTELFVDRLAVTRRLSINSDAGQTRPVIIRPPPLEEDMEPNGEYHGNAPQVVPISRHDVMVHQSLGHGADAPTKDGEYDKGVVHGAMPDNGLAESSSGGSDRDSVTNPGYAESLFSRAFTAPSVTSMGSKLGGVVQSAKVEMVAFFLADAELQPLFVAAIKDPSIGGDRLERNFRRLLVDYSNDILATTDIKRIYQHAAMLLRSESLFISQEICRKSNPLPRVSSGSLKKMERNDEPFEKGGPMMNRFLATMPQHNPGSGDAGPEATVEVRPVPDDGLQNKAELEQEELGRVPKAPAETDNAEVSILPALDEIKEFLSTGTHMNNLRTGLRKFVTPTIEQPTEQSVVKLDAERSGEFESARTVSEPESSLQGVPGTIFLRSLPDLVDYLFDFLPLPSWEPPVPPGKGRVRWKCKCGASLYDDFLELVPGSLKELETELRTANTGDSQSGHKHIWSVTEIWFALYSLMTRMVNSLRRGSRNDDITLLPVQNDPGPHQTSNPGTSEIYIRYLLCCMHIGETGTTLHQERIFRQLKDRELGILLNEVYRKRRNMLSWLSLRHVSKLHLTRFEVDYSAFVQVHLHKACDLTNCICLPSCGHITRGEYCCQPAPEIRPTRVPVLGDNYLMHFFKHSQHFKEDQETIFNQLPKRSWGQLAAPHNKLELGWGLYFEEGWHFKSICCIVALVVMGGLVFAIAWTISKGDIQGGFSVPNWAVAAVALVLGGMVFRSL